jgi:hypothetical protein
MAKPVRFRLAIAMAIKPSLRGSHSRTDHGHLNDDLIFSLTEGYVWASWPGTVASVKLGSRAAVTAVMRDFLAQCELGDRLTNAKAVDE